MSKATKIMTAEQVVSFLEEGSTLTTVGFSLMGACGTILNEIERQFLKTGYPRNLTLFHASGQSDRVNGIQRLAHKGLIKRIIGAHWGLAPKWGELIHNNEVEAICLPQGQIVHLFRAMASGKPGNFSKIGLHTFVDPRYQGGKINDRAKETDDMVELIHLQGEEYLFYKSLPIDVAIIRGTTADENGNVTIEEEASILETLSVAQATKACGGKVFVQVKYLAKRGSLNPKHVKIPGILVDGIIVAENPIEEHRQTSSHFYHPFYSGDLKAPPTSVKPLPLHARKVIGRRAAMELFPGAIVNLGTGIPGDTIGPVADEQNISHQITLTIESGSIGGVPEGGVDFGIVKNAEAIIEHGTQFDFYHGCGVDITFMGMAEADQSGNVNVSKFGSRTMGCGGFIDITQTARKVVFCGTFTVGGLEVEITNGAVNIVQEGRFKKFVEKVSHITFNGKYSSTREQQVIFVTERAVMELREEGLVLTEIAPGIDLQKDILEQMDFQPIVSESLKLMDQQLFEDKPMERMQHFV